MGHEFGSRRDTSDAEALVGCAGSLLLLGVFGFGFGDWIGSTWQESLPAVVIERFHVSPHSESSTGWTTDAEGNLQPVYTTHHTPESWSLAFRCDGRVYSADVDATLWADSPPGTEIEARWLKGYLTGRCLGWRLQRYGWQSLLPARNTSGPGACYSTRTGPDRYACWEASPAEDSIGHVGREPPGATHVPLQTEPLEPHWRSADRRMQLYHGDCLQILPHLRVKVDAVIGDPPYCSGGATPAERARDPLKKYVHTGTKLQRPSFGGDQRDARSFKYWCVLWASHCRELLRPGGYFLVFSDWRQLPVMTDVVQAAGFNWRGIIAWNKGRGARAPHKGYFRHQCEYVVWATNGPCPRTGEGPYDGCPFHVVKAREKRHICGKPVALMEDLVRIVPRGATVLDPFAGSSSTGKACQRLGRRFIGIEQSDAYFEESVSRLSAA